MTPQPNLTGHAILLGVSEVNPEHYFFDKLLYCALEDVKGMQGLLENTGLYPKRNIKTLCGPGATWGNFSKELKKLRELSKRDDIFLVVYISCHGSRATLDGYLWEVLCFYDRIVQEQEIREILKEIKPGSKAVVVIDSCHSGGQAYLKTFGDKLIAEDPTKELDKRKLQSVMITHWKSLYRQIVYDYLGVEYKFATEICYLMACEKDQEALIGLDNEPSYYTKNLLTHFTKMSEGTNYIAFQNGIREYSKANHTPTICIRNKQKPSHFENFQPFIYKTMTKKDNTEARTWTIDTDESNRGKHIKYILKPSFGKFEFEGDEAKKVSSGYETTIKVSMTDSSSNPSTIKPTSKCLIEDETGEFSTFKIYNTTSGEYETVRGRNKTKGRVRNEKGDDGGIDLDDIAG